MNVKGAIDYVREQLIQRINLVPVSIDTELNDIQTLAGYIFTQACFNKDLKAENGDYLWYNMSGVEINGNYSNGAVTITYCFNYYSTKNEEEMAEAKVNELIAQLGLSSMERAQQVKALYRYLSDKCSYDKSLKAIVFQKKDGTFTTKNIGRNSMYDVVVSNRAVCQGFSNTMYYILNKLGTNTRIIQGYEWYKNELYTHAWNLIQLSGRWYNTCLTAAVHYLHDEAAGAGMDDWLLKNDADLCRNPVKYIRLMNFEKKSFISGHPMANESFNFE